MSLSRSGGGGGGAGLRSQSLGVSCATRRRSFLKPSITRYHEAHGFEEHDPVVVGVFTTLCNHHHKQF